MITLESTYYVIGIVAMGLWIVVAVAAVVLAFQIRRKVKNIRAGFGGKAEAIAGIGLAFARFFVEKLKKSRR